MQITPNQIAVAQFSRSLLSLKTVIKKAQAFAQERKFEDSIFLQMRLAPVFLFSLVYGLRSFSI